MVLNFGGQPLVRADHRLVLGTDDVLGHAPVVRPRALTLQADR
jgi:hypothetical protein